MTPLEARRGALVAFRRAASLACCCAVLFAAPAWAQMPVVQEMRVEQEGRVVSDPAILGLLETRIGEPLSMAAVRETVTHLDGLNRFDDVQVFREDVAGGVRLVFRLIPRHPIDRVEFRGTVGLSQGELRRVVRDRFGAAPPSNRIGDVVDLLQQTYRRHGYFTAIVAPNVEQTHDPDRATLVLHVESGPRARITSINIQQVDPDERSTILGIPDIRTGEPYDGDEIDRELARYVERTRERGYYEARAEHSVTYEGQSAIVTLMVARGPLVHVAFSGEVSQIPRADLDRLVPIRAEGAVDEDLLEDSRRNIQEYLHERGYRDAQVEYTSTPRNGELTITFNVVRGPRFSVERIQIVGASAIPASDLEEALRLQAGDAFVQGAIDGSVAAIGRVYRSRGYTRAAVTASTAVLPESGAKSNDRRVAITVKVQEGPQAIVRGVTYRGNMAMSPGELTMLMTASEGRPYSEAEVLSGRDAIELEYRNRGYETVTVTAAAMLAENDTRADVTITISEGPQVFVDHIIIVGNERTSLRTIERELLVRPGEPLGYSAQLQSQQRLSALGLFRSVRITAVPHANEPRRDLLVQVEEAPPTTVGYGGGLEAQSRLRATGIGGSAEERIEFVPRGFFEIGRRNMWGKNRSINLFTRAALRATESTSSAEAPGEGDKGFNEYRIYGTFREPRILGTRADVLLTGIVDRAIRSSFNFLTREARAELGVRLSPVYSLAGRYSFQHTELFDVEEAERPIIDRLFPQVELSKFSGSLIRDTRDDPLDPGRGIFVIADAALAARAIGSEVGFVKTFLQAFTYLRLPTTRRMVLALGARVGLAHGFPRDVPRVDASGSAVLDEAGNQIIDRVQDLPASERFFAGGDTTVRGFSLDRLGNESTITPSGFPRGGNGEIVLNGELRVGVAGPLASVVFVDAGNVYPAASDIDVTDLRPAAGFGVHYRSPVGPVRVELGFNLDRRELVPGKLERGSVLHISFGQAF